MRTEHPLGTPEGVVRFETATQPVHHVTDEHGRRDLCGYHIHQERGYTQLSDQLARETGIRDETSPEKPSTISEERTGKCVSCERDQRGRPWEDDPTQPRRISPSQQERTPTRAPETSTPYGPRGRWPYQPLREHERLAPMTTTLPSSLNSRVAVRLGYDDLPPDAGPTQRFARMISEDMPDIVKMAHDSNDPEVIMHCPSCGSGQVIARSDGSVSCGFCQLCFTVQVAPQYPAFPQTIDGVPMKVPGMGPQWPGQGDTAQQAQEAAEGTVVPEQDPDAEEDPQEPDKDDGNPFAKASSYRSVDGDPLTMSQFLRHIALLGTPRRDRMLRTIRTKNGVR